MNPLWYPPAETYLPLSMLCQAFRPSKGAPEEALLRVVGPDVPVVFGCSGRALLCGLFQKLKRSPGTEKKDEVAIPGYTCYSVAAAVVRAGLNIRVYDLDPSNFHPEPDSLKRVTSEKTLAVVSQHLFGIPTALEKTAERAKAVGAVHIEDAAQALGGTLDGQPLGTFGDFGLFSFGRGKPLPLGGGGALIGKIPDIVNKCRLGRAPFGMDAIASNFAAKIFGNPLLYGIAENLPLGLGRTFFDPDFDQSGISTSSVRLLAASNGLLGKLNVHRRKIAQIYENELRDSGQVQFSKKATPVFTRFPLFVKNNSISDDLREFGIRRMYPQAIAAEKSIAPFLFTDEIKTPGAGEISGTLITLPTHLWISEKVAVRIVGALKKA